MKVCEGKLCDKCPFNHNGKKAEEIVDVMLGEAELCDECPFKQNAFVSGGHRRRQKDTIQYWESVDESEMPGGKPKEGPKVVGRGLARCVAEPQGDNGLEGYNIGDTYKFEECLGKKGRYFRVYPGGYPDYYETCGRNTFRRFFRSVA